MPPSNARNIIELRQLLAEKFPGVRLSAGRPETNANYWPTGVAQLDALLGGGLARSAITEISSAGAGSGSSLLLGAMARRSHEGGRWMALVDAHDSFDPTQLENAILARLLWARCTSPREAVKAADLLLRDGTIPLIALDLIGAPGNLLRGIPSSTWFRFERLVENTSTALAVFTPQPLISNARGRVILQRRFGLESLEADRETLLAQMMPQLIEPAASRRFVRSA